MNLEQIKTFISVVNHKSFSLAAKELFLSQPTISTHIKSMEEELRVQLLVRSTKDVVLTAMGLIFYPYALKMISTEQEALMQLHGDTCHIQGKVSFAVSSVPANYLIPSFLAYACKYNPEVSYKIAESDSMDVIHKISHYEAEIGIGGMNSQNSKCVFEPLAKDQIVLITPNTEYYRNMGANFPIETLSEEKYVRREIGSGTKIVSDALEKQLHLQFHEKNVVAQLGNTETIKHAVAEGVGIAFISKLAIEDFLKLGKILVFELDEVGAKREFYLIYHKERLLSPVALNTIELLRRFTKKK
ncbi:MAG: selenium metabolism-associated LysR family transcriptional regulator [Lachnospiraceae bacterium]